jgi:hypothetical protein
LIFTIPAKDKNSVKTIIGDELSTPQEFLPSIKLSRWDDEVSFKVGFDVSAITKASRTFSNLGNNNYQLTTPLLDFKIYPLPADKQMEDGGLEFEIILKAKPPTNKIILPIETTGLDFFYQPALTQEGIDHGAIRPENVVGSYAVYHSTKSNDYSLRGGKNYRTGKAFHIYRPKVIDNIGAWAWADLNVDVPGHKLTVTIPQAFLDSAVYPVRHAAGLTLGYTTIGASSDNNSANYAIATNWTMPGAAGVASNIKACVWAANNFKLAIYSNADPKALIANSSSGELTAPTNKPTQDSEWTGGAITASLAASTEYFLVINRANNATYIAWDGSTDAGPYVSNTYSTFPQATIGSWTAYNFRLSLYVTYAAGGGATYNESVTFSSTPALSHNSQADLLGSVALASTPTLSPAAIADLLGSIGLDSAPAASMIGGMDYSDGLTLLSNPAVSMAYLLNIFPSLILASNPALAASALADFFDSLTLASTTAAAMAAVADLFVSLALASGPAFAALGGSDFYESLALSSSPALAIAVFKEAFGELALSSSPALLASVQADLYAAITILSASGISMAAVAELFASLTLSSNPALSALGEIAGIFIQKMVMESIGFEEKTLQSEVDRLTGDIDIINRILTNPWDDIAKKSTTWEVTEKRKKDAQ